MEDGVLYIIDNTEKAQDDFGRRWGCDWNQITMNQINELAKGKQLAFSSMIRTPLIFS